MPGESVMASHQDMPSLIGDRINVRRVLSLCSSVISALASKETKTEHLLRVAYLYGYHDAMDQAKITNHAIEEELEAKRRRLENLRRQSEEIVHMMRQTSEEIEILRDWALIRDGDRPVDCRPGQPE